MARISGEIKSLVGLTNDSRSTKTVKGKQNFVMEKNEIMKRILEK